MKVIIINGSGKTGKDKFVKYFQNNSTAVILNVSTVDHIKKAAKKFFGWHGKKDDASRKFLSDIKLLCSGYNDGPFYYVVNQIEKKKCEINFVHCREPKEIQKFKDHYKDDLITILINRDDREVPNNDADQNVANYEYDYYIDNNGTEKDLENSVIEFIEKIK